MAVLTAELIAPLAALTFSVADRTPLEADISAAIPTVASQTGHAFVLSAPAALVEAQATTRSIIEIDLIAPSSTVEASTVTGAAAATSLLAPVPTVDSWTGSQVVLLASVPTVDAASTTNVSSGFYLTAPVGSVDAAITALAGFSADLVAPVAFLQPEIRAEVIAPAPRLLAQIQQPSGAEFEAYAVNLRSVLDGVGGEVTHYTNYPFTRIVRFGQQYYGVGADGLYLLDGDKDSGKPIEWALCTPTTDFGSNQKKNPASCYMGGRIGTPVSFTVFTGEAREEAYQYTSPRRENAQNHRQAFGRGLDARYYAFEAEGDGALELDDLSFEVNIKTRRI